MNLPFGLPVMKDGMVKRKDDSAELVISYERKLAEYRDTLEKYRKFILEFSTKTDGNDKKTINSELEIVQTALDLSYIKEQGDKIFEILDNMRASSNNKSVVSLDMISTAIADINSKLEILYRSMDLMTKNNETILKNSDLLIQNDEALDLNINILEKNIEGLDKNVVNRIAEIIIEMQKQTIYQNKQLHTEMVAGFEKINKTVKRGRIFFWFLLIFNLAGLCGIAFLILYTLDMLPF